MTTSCLIFWNQCYSDTKTRQRYPKKTIDQYLLRTRCKILQKYNKLNLATYNKDYTPWSCGLNLRNVNTNHINRMKDKKNQTIITINEEREFDKTQQLFQISLVVQGLRICPPKQGAWVWFLVGELRSHTRSVGQLSACVITTKPVCSGACTLHLQKSVHPRKACGSQLRPNTAPKTPNSLSL